MYGPRRGRIVVSFFAVPGRRRERAVQAACYRDGHALKAVALCDV